MFRPFESCGLRPDRQSVPQPGRIVFVYRSPALAHAATR